MATVHDLLVHYNDAKTALDAAKADSVAKRQAANDADNLVIQDEQAVADATNAVKTGLASAGASYIAKDDGTPQVEPDGSIQIFEPDPTTNGWHVTIARPSNVAIPDQTPVTPVPDQPTPTPPDQPTPDQPTPDQPFPPDQPVPTPPDQPLPPPDMNPAV